MDKDNNIAPPGPNGQNGKHKPARTADLKTAGLKAFVLKKFALKKFGFAIFMLALTVIFVYFGIRQTEKLAEMGRLGAIISERVKQAPIGLPPVAEWVGFDPQIYNLRPLTVTGTFDSGGTVLVFTRLLKARGTFFGPGYWVMAPLYLEGGGIVFINRGFVPEQSAPRFKQGGIAAQGTVTIVGLGRISQQINSFTPGTDFKNRIESVRNIKRLSQFLTNTNERVAPIYIDQQAGEPGALPQGGETRMEFANPHWEYALIWFFMAAIPALILLIRLFSNRKKTKGAQTEK